MLVINKKKKEYITLSLGISLLIGVLVGNLFPNKYYYGRIKDGWIVLTEKVYRDSLDDKNYKDRLRKDVEFSYTNASQGFLLTLGFFLIAYSINQKDKKT